MNSSKILPNQSKIDWNKIKLAETISISLKFISSISQLQLLLPFYPALSTSYVKSFIKHWWSWFDKEIFYCFSIFKFFFFYFKSETISIVFCFCAKNFRSCRFTIRELENNFCSAEEISIVPNDSSVLSRCELRQFFTFSNCFWDYEPLKRRQTKSLCKKDSKYASFWLP